MSKCYVAFIRGVTPKGSNRVPMAALREALSDTDLGEVSTYIQSGNVLVRADLAASRVSEIVHDTILEQFGGDLTVIVRTPAQLRRMLLQNPFANSDASRLYYTMLASRPGSAALSEFEALDTSPDDVEVVGTTIYTRYATRLSDSKFHNNVFERKLKVAATTRNWRTINAVIDRLG